MDLFRSYESDFKSVLATVNEAVASATYETIEFQRDVSQKAGRDVKAADELLKQMEFEARSLDPATRKDCQSACKTYKSSLKALKSDVTRLGNAYNRSDLLDGAGNGMEFTNRDQAKRLLETSNKLRNGTTTLEQSRRALAETEDIALGITEQLASNRATINSAQSKVRSVGDVVSRARRVLRNMDKRERNQKLTIVAVITLLIILVSVAFYFAFLAPDAPAADPADDV